MEPASVFSTGTTPYRASPRVTALKTSSRVVRGSSFAAGESRSMHASSLFEPRVPWYAASYEACPVVILNLIYNFAMAGTLENISVAILEHRFTKEFSTLFEKLGATVYACPLLEEKPVENRVELQSFVRSLLDGQIDMMIFLTGVGARFLVAESESVGQRGAFLEALAKMTIVVRGPKPVAALRQLGLRAHVVPENPTTEGVIEALRSQ